MCGGDPADHASDDPADDPADHASDPGADFHVDSGHAGRDRW